MTEQQTAQDIANIDGHLDYQVIVIGAGLSGIYQIKRLSDLGVRATVLDANADLGGTWYNNRYPGARFDSESYSYGYSFSQEVLDESDAVLRRMTLGLSRLELTIQVSRY